MFCAPVVGKNEEINPNKEGTIFQSIESEKIETTTEGLRICALNKGGTGCITGKLEEIRQTLLDSKIDVLGVSEAQVGEELDDEKCAIKGYKHYIDRGKTDPCRRIGILNLSNN